MTDAWERLTVKDLLERHGGSIKTGPFGTVLKASEYTTLGVPVISVGEVGYGRFRIDQSTPRAPDSVTSRLPQFLLEPGDIVFARKGAVDRSCLVGPAQAGWFLGSDGIRLRPPQECDARFLSYSVQGPESRRWLQQHALGTTMASLNQGVIERLPLHLPPLAAQRAIADVLGALDEMIESNRRVADAAVACMKGLAETVSGLPHVPLSSVAASSRAMIDPSTLGTVTVEHFSIPAFDADGLPEISEPSAIKSGKFAIDGPRVLVSRLNPRIPRIWHAVPNAGRGLASTEYLVMADANGGSLARVWLAVTHDSFTAELQRRATGTSGSHQRVRSGDALSVQVPDTRLAESATLDETDALLTLAHHERAESRTIARLRDALIPELLSGRLRLPEARERIEGVV